MKELIEKANCYAEENVINVLKEAFAKVYADGYRNGYKDRENEIHVNLCGTKTKFIDLGLPSGTLWSQTYEVTENETNSSELVYNSFEEAKDRNIPTVTQCRELLDICKWECIMINGIYNHIDCIGPNGNVINFYPLGYNASNNNYMSYKVLIWAKGDSEGMDKNVFELDATHRHIGSLFSGYKLPLRLIRAASV